MNESKIIGNDEIYGILLSAGSLDKGTKVNGLNTEEEYVDFLQKEIDSSELVYISYGFDSNNDRKEIAIKFISKNREFRMLFCSADKAKNNLLYCFSALKNPISNHTNPIPIKARFKIYSQEMPDRNLSDARKLVEYLKNHFEPTPLESTLPNLPKEEPRKDDFSIALPSVDRYRELTNSSVQILSCREILDIFSLVFSNAKSYIDIRCPWVYDFILEKYLPFIESALNRGVDITIRIGMMDKKTEIKENNKERVENILKGLEDKYDRQFRFYKQKDCDHSKVLLWNDDICEWILVGSFNFLSFYPIKEDNRHESAILTDSKKIIHKYMNHTRLKREIPN